MMCLIVPILVLLTTVLSTFASAVIYDELVDRLGFDRRYGTDTGTLAPLRWWNSRIPIHSGYMPAPVRTIRSIFDALPIIPSQFSLIDIGSGKGRALFVGAEAGFARCIGVERNPALCRTARRNLVAWQSRTEATTLIDIQRGDATCFAFPPGPLVVFMYNPFGAETMERVIGNLEKTYRRTPRPIFLVMLHPRFNGLVAGSGFLKPLWLRNTTTDFHSVFETA